MTYSFPARHASDISPTPREQPNQAGKCVSISRSAGRGEIGGTIGADDGQERGPPLRFCRSLGNGISEKVTTMPRPRSPKAFIPFLLNLHRLIRVKSLGTGEAYRQSGLAIVTPNPHLRYAPHAPACVSKNGDTMRQCINRDGDQFGRTLYVCYSDRSKRSGHRPPT